MIRRLFIYIYKSLNPLGYAKKIGVQFGDGCRLIKVDFSTEPYLIKMGNHVSATKVRFETHDGGVWVFRNELPKLDVIKGINIGDNVFLGYGAVIMPGITIGSNVVVGAYSVVTKDLEAGYIYGGVPARKIKSLNEYKEKVISTGVETKQLEESEKREYLLSLSKQK
ncbi:acyltransferase [Alteromonas sp. M12]|uniref:acyltransferase n=1 Tax=Alteromonas sp. M12 TaxID=3135644 RepID=UPI00319E5AF6